MGKSKYTLEIENLFKKSPVVTAKSIEMIINRDRKVKQYARQLIRNLVLKGRIRRIARGFYTSGNDTSLSVFCFKPAYLGLQDALSLHDLWEQETVPIIVSARKIRAGVRNVMGGNVLVRRISRKYLFGFEYHNQNNVYLPYSDIEKTLIDLAYFNERLDRETLNNIRKKVDMKKLESYLSHYPKRFRRKVLALL